MRRFFLLEFKSEYWKKIQYTKVNIQNKFFFPIFAHENCLTRNSTVAPIKKHMIISFLAPVDDSLKTLKTMDFQNLERRSYIQTDSLDNDQNEESNGVQSEEVFALSFVQ